VIHIPTAPWLHHVGDLFAWSASLAGARWVYLHRRASVAALARQTEPGYFLSLGLGAAAGAWAAGSANTLRAALPVFSHSIAGALAGGILAVELWKWRHRVRRSTGGPFVIPLALGIIVGRWGCLFAGPADETYGIAMRAAWGVDLGDGIARHPVQIYESLSIAVFLAIYWLALIRQQGWAQRFGFHAFVLFYAAQRFGWEFLKPYPKLLGPFNLFHLIMLGLAVYAVVWIVRGSRAGDDGPQDGALYFPRADDELVRNLPGDGAREDHH